MQLWSKYPVIYEINTWVWLAELSHQAGRQITLGDVPQNELERIAGYGFDGVWLMGVWQRSPGARHVARTYPGWQSNFQSALPDLTTDDIIGSPYAIYDYRVDRNLGDEAGLAKLRARMAEYDLLMMLDFVPNHMAIDHPWLEIYPECFLAGDQDSLERETANYFKCSGGGIFAHGRDPYFEGWPDTAQLDYRSPFTRRAMRDALLSIAERCDGVRCDMAMLLTREVFQRTWGGGFDPPQAEFWPAAITDLKASHPNFLLMAEVYWDMEWELQQQGFDHTYDKRLYDRLLHEGAQSVRQHLTANLEYQSRLARFIENHDEARSAEAFGVRRSRAAAVASLTLPGLRLLHEGQLEGRRIKLPVHLGRRPLEEQLPEMSDFYYLLLDCLDHPVFHEGQWRLLEAGPVGDGPHEYKNALIYQWTLGRQIRLIAVNYLDQAARFCIPLQDLDPGVQTWLLDDLMNGEQYQHSGADLHKFGLYVNLPAFGYHLFDVSPV